MNQKAGCTPLRKSIELCGRCNGATVYVKDESKNPFGTFKDRRCAALLDLHAQKEELVFVQITSGNSGYSLGMMAKEWELKTGRKRSVVNIVPKSISKEVRKRLETCSLVCGMDLGEKIVTFENMVEIARKASGYSGPDTNLVGVEDYRLEGGYREMVREIADEGIRPGYIFCPVGEGELAVELAGACASVWGYDPPKVVGVTIKQNVILYKKNFLKNPGKSIADKLVNGYSKFKDLLMSLVKKGRVELMSASEREIAAMYGYLNQLGIAAEPTAASAFCGAVKYDLKPDDVVVIINTGKGIFDQGSVDKRWAKRIANAAKYVVAFALGVAVAATAYRTFVTVTCPQTIEKETK